ncbi:hypothetical protein [Mycobacteroides abscessus]|uniref:hypothetical protein n=1 Tax=Mycobacteroides abscessus TaxID=36809 RepID=UPI000C2648CB|nr:hypothetical protein [Mycobacteroides abscessus]
MTGKAFGVEQIGDCLLLRPEAVRDMISMGNWAIPRAMARPETRKHVRRWEAQRAVAIRAFESRMSPSGHGDVAEQDSLRESYVGQGNWIDTADAAARTGLSRRQLQRIARALSVSGQARRVGNSWAINPDVLSAYIIERQSRQEP